MEDLEHIVAILCNNVVQISNIITLFIFIIIIIIIIIIYNILSINQDLNSMANIL
jgi:hypothetical protein